MSFILSFLIFFVAMSFLGGFSLRWYALEFLYRQMDIFWKDISGLIFTTLGFAVIVCSILFFILHKMVKAAKEIKQTGVATEAQKQIILKAYNSTNIVIGVANFSCFVLGQALVMGLDIQRGAVPFAASRVTIIMCMATLISIILAVYEINFLNNRMAKFRALLNLHHISDFTSKKPLKISTKIIFITVIILLFMGLNGFACSYSLIHGDNLPKDDKMMLTYLCYGAAMIAYNFVLCIGLVLSVALEMKNRIKQTTETLQAMTQKADISSRLKISMNDDLSIIPSELNNFMDQLSAMFQGILQGTKTVSDSAETLIGTSQNSLTALFELYESFQSIKEEDTCNNNLIKDATILIDQLTQDAKQIVDQVTRQSVAVQQSSSSITQMTSSIQQVSEVSAHASELSQELKEKSEAGYNAIATAVDATKEIQKASLQVQEIMEVIQAIASQTNLLSMNAAIEAAHAGDFGKGFAVVAEEVRSLAESSTASATTIEEHINNMIQKIENGVNAITAAGEAFHAITDRIEKTSDIIQSITLAMEEQLNGATETLTSTTSIVGAIQTIQDLATRQSNEAQIINDTFNNILDSSNKISSNLEQNAVTVDRLDISLQNIEDQVQTNAASVGAMTESVRKFKI